MWAASRNAFRLFGKFVDVCEKIKRTGTFGPRIQGSPPGPPESMHYLCQMEFWSFWIFKIYIFIKNFRTKNEIKNIFSRSEISDFNYCVIFLNYEPKTCVFFELGRNIAVPLPQLLWPERTLKMNVSPSPAGHLFFDRLGKFVFRQKLVRNFRKFSSELLFLKT